MAKPNEIYEVKATLRYITPPIWRRLQIRADATLEGLHYALQDAFGWTNSHLHRFLVGKRSYGMILDELDDDLEDDRGVKLRDVARLKSKLVYHYDFGDDWEHDLVIEKGLPAEKGVHYPRCLDGARACPPEDCGGPHGYEEVVEILASPKHERHQELLDWLDADFAPERFDLRAVNRALAADRTRKLTEKALSEEDDRDGAELDALVLHWDGRTIPETLRELPPGSYLIAAVEPSMLTPPLPPANHPASKKSSAAKRH